MVRKTIIQVGQSRDGGRYYCRPARAADNRIVLIDGPEGKPALEKGRAMGEPDYDEVRIARSSRWEDLRGEVEHVARQEGAGRVIPGFELHTLNARKAAGLLGLETFNSEQEIERFRYKALQREWLKAHALGVRQPQFFVCPSRSEFEAALGVTDFPVVLKIDDSGGSLGVCRADSAREALDKYAGMVGLTRDDGLPSNGVMLIEELIDGPEFSLQGVVDRGGNILLLGMSKKTIVSGSTGDRFMEEQHLICPPPAIPPAFTAMAEEALATLVLRASPFHIDLRTSKGKPIFIETGARMSGAGVPRLLSAATGRDWAELALKAWSGESLTLPPGIDRFAGARFITPPANGSPVGYRLRVPPDGPAGEESATITIFQSRNGAGYQHITDRVGTVEAAAATEERTRKLIASLAAAFTPLGV